MVMRVGPARLVGLVLASALVAAACTTEPAVTSTTLAASSTTSSTTTLSTTPSAVAETTSTTSMEQRIAEVTEIVREVEFGWFDAIYRKDEKALADVVGGSGERYDIGVELMGDSSFFSRAKAGSRPVIVCEVLIDREDCLAVVVLRRCNGLSRHEAVGEVTGLYSGLARPMARWRSAYLGDEWHEACDDFSRENQLP